AAVHGVDMAPRFAYVREHGEALASRLLERLAGRGSFPMLWNPLPWARDAVVAIDGRPTRVRAGGLGLSPAVAAEGDSRVKADGEAAIENGPLRVEVDADGSFIVVDRATGERGGRQNRLISEGDRGDEYTYSYAGPTVGSEGLSGTRATSVTGDRATATVELVLRLPARLRHDRDHFAARRRFPLAGRSSRTQRARRPGARDTVGAMHRFTRVPLRGGPTR